MKTQIKEFYGKYRVFIYPAVVSVASLIIIILVLIPQIQAFIDGRSTLEDANQKSKFLETKASELSNIDSEDLSKKLSLAVSSLPTDKDYGSIIGIIQRIGSDTGARIVSLSISSGAAEKNVGFSVQLTVIGLKESVDRMIENIENSPRIMKVSNMEISTSRTDGAVGADFVVNVFYEPAPKTLGSIESELPKFSQADEEILARLASTSLSTTSPSSPTGPSQLLPRGKANPFQ